MRKASVSIDQHTRVPIGWVAAGMVLVFSLLPSLVTMRMLDERTKDLPATLKDHETRIVVIETRQGMRSAAGNTPVTAKASVTASATDATKSASSTTEPVEKEPGPNENPILGPLAWTGGIAQKLISALIP